MTDAEQSLSRRGIRPTANRLLVLRQLDAGSHPVSMTDLETALYPMDKSSIFRVLTLFADLHLVHVIDDGSGAMKYELCPSHEECSVSDMHAHFHCTVCGRTICLESVHIPTVPLPDGFTASGVNYIVKGTCADCAR